MEYIIISDIHDRCCYGTARVEASYNNNQRESDKSVQNVFLLNTCHISDNLGTAAPTFKDKPTTVLLYYQCMMPRNSEDHDHSELADEIITNDPLQLMITKAGGEYT